jgi:hypothetical protein
MTNTISYFLLENDGRLCPKAHQLVQDIRLRLRWVDGDSYRHLWGYLAVRPIYKCPLKGQNINGQSLHVQPHLQLQFEHQAHQLLQQS